MNGEGSKARAAVYFHAFYIECQRLPLYFRYSCFPHINTPTLTHAIPIVFFILYDLVDMATQKIRMVCYTPYTRVLSKPQKLRRYEAIVFSFYAAFKLCLHCHFPSFLYYLQSCVFPLSVGWRSLEKKTPIETINSTVVECLRKSTRIHAEQTKKVDKREKSVENTLKLA